MPIRIIFVDSDTKVLQGLKRSLHAQRHQWEMTFVDDGLKALDYIERTPVDMVVTDLRLPGIDGIQLLDTVRKQHSHIIRIVLSGESDQEWILRSVRVSHQFLNKPCKPRMLKATVERNYKLVKQMGNTSVRKVVGRMASLPSLPTIYAEIMDAIQAPNASINRIGQIMAKDMAMTAKILQMVNSAFFGVPRHISNPAQAAVMLGINTVKSLALSIQVFSQFSSSGIPSPFLEQLWQHNAVVGKYSKRIAEFERQDMAIIDLAYMAGLLHDIGKLVLAVNFPGEYTQVISRSQQEGRSLYDSEHEVFDVTHAEVGGYLLNLWGLPLPIVEALAFHHDPGQSIAREFCPLTAVHAANGIINGTQPAMQTDDPALLDTGYLVSLGLGERYPRWMDALNGPDIHEVSDEPQSSVC